MHNQFKVIFSKLVKNECRLQRKDITCDYTVTTYGKQPAKPGETLRVGTKMTPKDTGLFDEVITIKYNSINNQPVKVGIKGNVR